MSTADLVGRHAGSCFAAAEQATEREEHARALALLEDIGSSGESNPLALVRADALTSLVHIRRGDVDAAAHHAAAAVAAARLQSEPLAMAYALVASARVSWRAGEHHQALAELESAWPVVERHDDWSLRFHCQNTTAVVFAQCGEYEESIDWHTQAAITARAAGAETLEAMTLANLAGRWLDIGDRSQRAGQSDEAKHAWAECVERNDRTMALVSRAGAIVARRVVATNRGVALARLGRFESAQNQLAEAEELCEQSRNLDGVAVVVLGRARMRLAQDRSEEAYRELANLIVRLEREKQARVGLQGVHELASELCEARGDVAEALRHHRRFHALHVELADERTQQKSRLLAIRLKTERALKEAADERARAERLVEHNRELTRTTDRLQDEAHRDPLTGLANRRQLDAALARAFEGARTGLAPACVAMVDVDHFKAVNDTYSHQVGDRVLQQVARTLQAQARGHDLVGRYGGEEFCVILCRVDVTTAHQVCERLRSAIERADWAAIAPALKVTASFGMVDVASFNSLEDCLAATDERLYQAKRAGRNRVVVYGAMTRSSQARER
jgi:diguanylate cyclase